MSGVIVNTPGFKMRYFSWGYGFLRVWGVSLRLTSEAWVVSLQSGPSLPV